MKKFFNAFLTVFMIVLSSAWLSKSAQSTGAEMYFRLFLSLALALGATRLIVELLKEQQ